MFANKLDQISNRHSISQVFDDFLQMSVCAFTLGKMEKEYLETVKRYDKKEVQLFSEALGCMVEEYESKASNEGGWDDVLGHFFESVNSASTASRNGQFFTPPHLCDLMAQITASDLKETEERTSVNDPTSGSGRNLIAHSRLNPQNRLKTFYVAQDLDYRCVKMCVLNFVMFGMSGVVIHMNALSLEIYGGYRVWLPETGMMVTPLSVDDCNTFIFSKNKSNSGSEGEKKIGQQVLTF